MPIHSISTGPHPWTFRLVTDARVLGQLTESIRYEREVVSPLLLRMTGDGDMLQLIDGGLRLRAALQCRMEDVPAAIVHVAANEAACRAIRAQRTGGAPWYPLEIAWSIVAVRRLYAANGSNVSIYHLRSLYQRSQAYLYQHQAIGLAFPRTSLQECAERWRGEGLPLDETEVARLPVGLLSSLAKITDPEERQRRLCTAALDSLQRRLQDLSA
ncbi:MAG: hypothetical protein H0U67_04750 [Gemmatimonadetes bacterium]|nr:hypothetical protein [Gemmatimonadota bacterium]